MNDWYQHFIAEERRRDFEREFALRRLLAKEASSDSYKNVQRVLLAKEPTGDSLILGLWAAARQVYRRWMVILGSWMVTLGCRLRSRYELTGPQPLPESETAPCS